MGTIIRENSNIRLYSQNQDANDIWRSVQPEIDDLQAEIWRIFNNTRATTADIEGIETWEAIYDILPNLHRDTLEERRDRILEWKRTREPFTETWLHEQLYNRGGGYITAEIEGLNMTLRYINMPDAPRRHRELMPWIRQIIPANILIFSLMSLPKLQIKRPVKIKGAVFMNKTQTVRGRPLSRPFEGQIGSIKKIKAASFLSFSSSLIEALPTRPGGM